MFVVVLVTAGQVYYYCCCSKTYLSSKTLSDITVAVAKHICHQRPYLTLFRSHHSNNDTQLFEDFGIMVEVFLVENVGHFLIIKSNK